MPFLIPSTQSVNTEKHTVTQNLRRKLPEIAPGTTVSIRISEQHLWDKKGTVAIQNNCPQLYDILNERRNILAKNRHHLIPTTIKFNIKRDYHNAIKHDYHKSATHLLIRI